MTFIVFLIAALTGVFVLALADFSWENFLFGAVLASVLVAVYFRRVYPWQTPKSEFVWHLVVRIPIFVWYLTVDILKGTWLVTMYVLGIRQLEHPGIVKIPFGNHSDDTVGLMGHLVTISPGSFLVDIDWDDRTMLVHYIDAGNPAQLRADVEKYYRLWEYGSHLPQSPIAQSPDEGGSANA